MRSGNDFRFSRRHLWTHQHHRAPLWGEAGRGAGRKAFTLVELLVASVVMATALLGIYGMFYQVMKAETGAALRADQRAAAQAVADHLADTLERVVALPEVPAIEAGQDRGGNFLMCFVGGSAGSGSRVVALDRRRYAWNFAADAGADRLELQVMPYAGSKNLATASGVGELPESELWFRVQPTVIGTRLDELSVSFKPLSDPRADWADTWSGPVGDVQIRIRVIVGAQTVERFVVPSATAALFEKVEG